MSKPKPRLRRIYNNMLQRCYNPKNTHWEYYGGVGVEVCFIWRISFRQFKADMGEPPTEAHTLDRIDGSIGYCKENCRWATREEQVDNRSNNITVVYKNEEWRVKDLAAKVGTTRNAFYQHLYKGKSVEETVKFFKSKNKK